MKYLIDSHCHIHHVPYQDMGFTLESFVENQFSGDQALSGLMCVSIELEDVPKLLKIQSLNPNIKISLGQHPNDTHIDQLDLFNHQCNQLLRKHSFSAIGETGLDYYRDTSCKKTQQSFFEAHIHLAKEHKLPLIIHTRQAREDTIHILKKHTL